MQEQALLSASRGIFFNPPPFLFVLCPPLVAASFILQPGQKLLRLYFSPNATVNELSVQWQEWEGEEIDKGGGKRQGGGQRIEDSYMTTVADLPTTV